MKKLNFIIKYGLALLLLSFYSCESWLNVTPSDRLSEEMLFNDREGFVKALNGVYIELNTNELYGRNLTAGALDVMGQYYSVASSSHAFYNYGGLVYTGNDEKALFDNMWQKCYAVIACCNTIIEKCDENKAGLSPVWKGSIKGEALALRAMLHFDMLRLFGPLTSELDKESIPYFKDCPYYVDEFYLSGGAQHNRNAMKNKVCFDEENFILERYGSLFCGRGIFRYRFELPAFPDELFCSKGPDGPGSALGRG